MDYGGCLENSCGGNLTGGSNPSPSASKQMRNEEHLPRTQVPGCRMRKSQLTICIQHSTFSIPDGEVPEWTIGAAC